GNEPFGKRHYSCSLPAAGQETPAATPSASRGQNTFTCSKEIYTEDVIGLLA
ncbi:UPF0761 membrane protein, partial [Dissostichus eleginoides]